MKVVNETMEMREISTGLPVPAGASVVLKPGSYHVMFTVIPRRVDQGHAERNTCAQRLFFQSCRMSAQSEMPGALTDGRDNGAVPQLQSACWSVGSKN